MASASSQEDELIVDLARDMVVEIAPEELPIFRRVSKQYLVDPERALRGQSEQDEMLGFGVGEAVVLLSPIALEVAREVVKFVAAEVAKALKAEAGPRIQEAVRILLKGKKAESASSGPGGTVGQADQVALTRGQLEQVHQLAYSRAVALKLADDQAKLLADSLVGRLAIA